MTIYRITDWASRYENNRTRELKNLEWFPMPNRMDGDGYTELLDHKDGPLHFAAWVAMVQVASRCDPRGTLVRDSAAGHDPASLGRISRIPAKAFEGAIPRLIEIGWLSQTTVSEEVGDIPHDDAGKPQQGATKPQHSALNGREGKGKKGREIPPLPEGLKSQEMASAWNDWITYRDAKGKPVSALGAQGMFRDFLGWGEEVAILAIRTAIKMDWQGVFKPKPRDIEEAKHAPSRQLTLEEANRLALQNANFGPSNES